jgi:hypothetical protein
MSLLQRTYSRDFSAARLRLECLVSRVRSKLRTSVTVACYYFMILSFSPSNQCVHLVISALYDVLQEVVDRLQESVDRLQEVVDR